MSISRMSRAGGSAAKLLSKDEARRIAVNIRSCRIVVPLVNSIIVACVSVSRTLRATKQYIWPSQDDGFSLVVARAGRKFFKSCG
jgi:hypothetical protein